MLLSIFQPECMPWLGLIDKIRQADSIVFLDNVQFKKRYFENRNKIKTKEGWLWLVVPVVTKGKFEQKINEVLIAPEPRWKHKFALSIERNYCKAPFWKDYGQKLFSVIDKEYEKLVDFNMSIIKFIMDCFELKRSCIMASELNTSSKGSELILEICKKMETDNYLSGRDGRNYLDLSAFEKNNIAVRFQNFQHPIYKQIHEGFLPCMSSVDILFNCGAESLKIIEESQKNNL